MTTNTRLLGGKVALVTGSSRGIGAAIARRLALEGAQLVIHGRDPAAMASVVEDIETKGGRAISVTADVTNFEQLRSAQRDIERLCGPVDILVANAGGSFSPPMPVEEIPEDGWQASIAGNLTATFLTIKCFLPAMKLRRSGAIVTLSSAAGRIAHPRAPVPYAVAKAGIELLTQNVAAQAGAFNVRANCIAPDTILTERNAARIPLEQQKALAEMRQLHRLGTPEDIAEAVTFLVSEQSSWITGAVLDVNGGAFMGR